MHPRRLPKIICRGATGLQPLNLCQASLPSFSVEMRPSFGAQAAPLSRRGAVRGSSTSRLGWANLLPPPARSQCPSAEPVQSLGRGAPLYTAVPQRTARQAFPRSSWPRPCWDPCGGRLLSALCHIQMGNVGCAVVFR